MHAAQLLGLWQHNYTFGLCVRACLSLCRQVDPMCWFARASPASARRSPDTTSRSPTLGISLQHTPCSQLASPSCSSPPHLRDAQLRACALFLRMRYHASPVRFPPPPSLSLAHVLPLAVLRRCLVAHLSLPTRAYDHPFAPCLCRLRLWMCPCVCGVVARVVGRWWWWWWWWWWR
jgi:hypothetical protein